MVHPAADQQRHEVAAGFGTMAGTATCHSCPLKALVGYVSLVHHFAGLHRTGPLQCIVDTMI